MHMRTDHDEAVAILFCDHCIVTTTVATYSPVFTEMLERFTGTHASCAQSGRPDFSDADEERASKRARALYTGLNVVHDLTR